MPTNKISEDVIQDINVHIMSYGPTISHYRRTHAPKRLYLSPELSLSQMHHDYIAGGGKCSYLAYRNQIISRNISFAKLGSEECEICLEHKEQICTTTDENCQICVTYEPHLMAERKSWEEYISGKVIINNLNTCIFSVDLQKVIMLPRLPGVKSVAFTPHVIAFNETFAPLGNKSFISGKEMKPYAVTWHEALGGRSACEICSAYKLFLCHHRDIASFVFWADNCSSQNKCWYLYTLLASMAN